MDELKRKKYAGSYYSEILSAEGAEKAAAIWADANARYAKLVSDNGQDPTRVREHTEGFIFPAIAAYQALLAADGENALRIMETAESRVSEKSGKLYAGLVRPRFMRRVFLRIFSRGTKAGFSEASGFENHMLTDRPDDVAFEITMCPYHTYCVKYGCPELTQIFCHNDINAYGSLPGIAFERQETLGTGGKRCDFHLYLKDK